MSTTVNIAECIYEGPLHPIEISDSDLKVTIDKVSFEGCHTSGKGGCAYVDSKQLKCSRCCCYDSGSDTKGGTFYFETINENYITACSFDNCKTDANYGDVKMDYVNISNCESTMGYDDEVSSNGATVKFCGFYKNVAVDYICSVEDIETDDKKNYANNLIFVECTSSSPGSWCTLTSYRSESKFDMVIFISNNIPDGSLVGQRDYGQATLTNAYFDPNNICARFVSSKVSESNRLASCPDIVIEKKWEECYVRNCLLANNSDNDIMNILVVLQMHLVPLVLIRL